MKKFNLKAIPVLLLLPGLMYAAVPRQIESEIPVSHVFAPAGFDSNDSAEVVVSGYLPNLCYRAPRSHVEVKGNKINIGLKAYRNVENYSFCAQVILPYVEIVNIGLLDQGKYQLAVNEASPYEKKVDMKVAEASSNSIDDFVYANVNQVINVPNSRKVILKGINPSDCFQLNKIEVVDNGSDVYSVLPKLRQISEQCPRKDVPFSYEFNVPENLKADQVLLHVRIMDGKSLNALYNNQSPAEE